MDKSLLNTDDRLVDDIDNQAMNDFGLEKNSKKITTKKHSFNRLNNVELINELEVYQYEIDAQHEELVKANNEIERLSDKYNIIYNFSPVGYFTFSKNYSILEANITGAKMLGTDRLSIIQMNFIDFVSPESKETYFDHINNVLVTKEKQSTEIVIQKSNGETYYAQLISVPNNIDLNKYYVEIYSAMIDISIAKKAEEKINNLNKELEHRVNERTAMLEETLDALNAEIAMRQNTEEMLIKSKEEITNAYNKEKELNELTSRFINMISHEYRTPLTVILTSTYVLDALLKNNDFSSYKDKIDMIRSSVQSMNKLLENVLVMNKLEKKGIQVHYSNLNLIELTEQILNEIKIIDRESHIFNLIIEGELHNIMSDSSILRYILNNLLSNAIKYSKKGTLITFKVSDNEHSINFMVADQGIGIDKKDIKHLFEPFQRGNNIGNVSGFGLGLSIVKESIDAIKGKIDIVSEKGKGTTFNVSIPKIIG